MSLSPSLPPMFEMQLKLPLDSMGYNTSYPFGSMEEAFKNSKYRFLSRVFSYIIPINCLISSIVTILLLVISIKKGVVGSSTKLFITTIFALDLIAILILLFLGLEFHYTYQNVVFMDVTIYLTEMVDIILLASNWITTLLGLERCLAVRNPFLAKRIVNLHRVVAIIAVIFSAIVLKASTIITLNWKDVYEKHNETTIQSLEETNVFKHTNLSIFMLFQSWVVDFAIFLVIPFTIMCWVSVILLRAIRSSKVRLRSRLSNEINQIKQRNEYKVTIFLSVVLLHFLIFQGPIAIYTALYSVDPLNSKDINKYQYILRPIFVVIYTMKSEANLAFYLYHNYQFRNRLYQIVNYRPSATIDCSEYLNLHPRVRCNSTKTVSLQIRLSTSSNIQTQ